MNLRHLMSLSLFVVVTMVASASADDQSSGSCPANFLDPTCEESASAGYGESGLFPVCPGYPECGQGAGGDGGLVVEPVVANSPAPAQQPDASDDQSPPGDGQDGGVEDCEPGFGVTCGDDVPPSEGDAGNGDSGDGVAGGSGGSGDNDGFTTCFPLSCTDDADTSNPPPAGGQDGDCTPGFGVTCEGEGDAGSGTPDTGDDNDQGDTGGDNNADDPNAGGGDEPEQELPPTTGYCSNTPAGYDCDPNNNLDSIYSSSADTLIFMSPGRRLAYPFTTVDSTSASGVVRFKSIAQGGAGYQWRTWVSRAPGGQPLSQECEMESLPEDFFYWTQAGDQGYCDLGNTGGIHYFNFEVYCITPDASGNPVAACNTAPLWPRDFIFEYRRQVLTQ